METFIPLILFIVIWVIAYKYFTNKKLMAKWKSHLLSFIVSYIVITIVIITFDIKKEETNSIKPENTIKKEQPIQIDPKEEEEKKKQKEIEEKFNKDINIPLKDAKLISLKELEDISTKYVSLKGLDSSYNKKFYDCLGELIWDKDENLSVSKILDWCYDGYTLTENKGMKRQYYNKAWLLDDFSRWDGSYRPLEEMIKKNMHNDDSYKHVETRYEFVLSGVKTPYMKVRTKYKGTNKFNAIVNGYASIKINAITKEVLDIEFE